MYNVFPVTRKSLDPVGIAKSIDGAKRAPGSLLNVFNGTVVHPAHWHLHLQDEIIVTRTDVGKIIISLYCCHLCMSVNSCGTHLDAIFLIFSKSFQDVVDSRMCQSGTLI